MRSILGAVSLILTVGSPGAGAAPIDPLRQWPQWRGPIATGEAPHADPPVEWSEHKNVRWKVALPGLGLSTPIVWGDRLFVTTAVPFGDPVAAPKTHDHGAHDNLSPARKMRFVVLALARTDGRVLWRTTVREERPHEATHSTGSWASASPITDGTLVYASFGSRGLYALEAATGEVVWEKDLGDMQTRHSHGEGSSPALHDDRLIVNWDHQGDSFIVALDRRTGKERWRVARDEITSWSSPLIVEHRAGTQVIVAATGRVRSYSLDDGELLWECGGLSRNVVATPVAGDGLVFVANSYDWQAMLAIRLDDAKGDITAGDAIAWRRDRHTPYVPSPLLQGGLLYFLRHNQAFLTAVDAATGEPRLATRRLPGVRNIFASPVGAAGRSYVTSREGTTVVIGPGPDFAILATNQLDDSFSASAALAASELYLRGRNHIYCLAEETPATLPSGADP